jgi:hypothetical protein
MAYISIPIVSLTLSSYPEWSGGVNAMYHGILHLDEKQLERRVHLEMEVVILLIERMDMTLCSYILAGW